MELERARRLPVFIDEEQWERAFKAAKLQVDQLYASGQIDVPSGCVSGRLHAAAIQIATAALRAAAQDDVGDIGDGELEGVTVSQVPPQVTYYPPDQSRPMSKDDTLHYDGLI
jgi:hypothetical protein